jgi:hypothetical protein
MRVFNCVAIALMMVLPAMVRADETTKARAEGALALAQAHRERHALAEARPPVELRSECFTDLNKAIKAAAKDPIKQLVLWVGMRCEAMPAIRDGLNDCVHCHADDYAGDSTPRLMLLSPNGSRGISFAREKIGKGQVFTLESIRRQIGSVPDKVIEPVKEVVPVLPATTFGPDCPNGKCPNASPTTRRVFSK